MEGKGMEGKGAVGKGKKGKWKGKGQTESWPRPVVWVERGGRRLMRDR